MSDVTIARGAGLAGASGGAATAGVAEALREPLSALLFAVADDELVIGHRHSEWTGFAPHIEEDVAMSSIAQDEIGHAAVFYGLLSELGAGDPDDLAFLRDAPAFRNAVLLERPNGDWGYTVARHYVYDVFEAARLDALSRSAWAPLARAAAKLRREEKYHRMHAEGWVRRLAEAGGEARRRLEAGFAAVWPEVAGLAERLPGEADLAAAGLWPVDREAFAAAWLAEVRGFLEPLGLEMPGGPGRGFGGGAAAPAPAGRSGRHTADLEALLADMTQVYRLDPEAAW